MVGLGMGQLYKKVVSDLGMQVITVDPNTAVNADFLTVDQCLDSHRDFDVAIICTPNYTHYDLAMKIAPGTKVLFVDKPGVANESEWRHLLSSNPRTRIMMIKNNMWRQDADQFKLYADASERVSICWINRNRVPRPGSWFTDKSRAFGGVSRDLMPHLLSIYASMNPADYQNGTLRNIRWQQRWTLDDLQDSDYGAVVADGVYDVDDVVEFEIQNNSKTFHLVADWRDSEKEDIGVHYRSHSLRKDKVLGLCPEEAYSAMIQDAITHQQDDEFWRKQAELDGWIHRIVELVTDPAHEVKHAA